MKKQQTTEDQLYFMGWCFIIAGGIGASIYLKWFVPKFAMPCVFYHYFGIYCPGCGGTRAFLELLHGRLLSSLWYHPLVVYTAVVFGGFMLTQTIERIHIKFIKGWKYHAWHLYAAVGILIVNWIVKNVLLYFYNISI